jgi:hypothetical protein
MPANIAFPTSSWPGDQGEGAGRLINVFADKEADKITWYRSPGLSAFADTGFSYPRGMLATDSALYVAVEGKLISINAAGVATAVGGALSGNLPVTMARNNKIPTPDIAIVSDAGAFTISGGSVVTWVDPDVGSPNSVSLLDAYFIFTYGDGSIISSDLNSTAINALSTAKAEANPDGIIRGTVSGRQFYAWGPSSLEIFDNAGTSPFPLARSTVVPVGLFGQWAIAGYEDGWDLSQIFVASDGTVRRLNGYQPERVSNRAVERDIQSVAVASTLRACVYTVAGNAFWVLSSPTWTWEYNATTGEWNERRSYGLTRWRGETSARAFGRWVVGDTQSTSILHIGSQWMGEGGDPLVARAEGVMKDFPARIRVPVVDFDFTVGQGVENSPEPNAVDPQVLLSWSHDGGATWSNPLWRPLGRQGDFKRQIRLFNTGRSTPQGVRFAWEIPDPAPFQFRGATVLNPIPRKP